MHRDYAAAYPELYLQHWWWRVREKILLQKLSSLFERGTQKRRLLDVGCGAGLFFDALQRFGTVEGIESDTVALARSGRWRNRIVHGELDASFQPSEPYDAILMLDLLEHVRKPDPLLSCARALLKPDGRLVITVPAFNWLWTRHDDINQHVRRYSSAQLRRLVEGADLVVTEATYLFQSLVIPKAVVRLKEAVFSGEPQVPRVPRQFLNRALQGWFQMEYRFGRRLPFGTSVMLVAKLPDRKP